MASSEVQLPTSWQRPRILVIIKPDILRRGLKNDVMSGFTEAGLGVKDSKELTATKEQAEAHYAEHKDKDFYDELIDFTASNPSFVIVYEGDGVTGSDGVWKGPYEACRDVMGHAHPGKAKEGTIRNLYALDSDPSDSCGDDQSKVMYNVVDASDSVEAAKRDIAIWFGKDSHLLDDSKYDQDGNLIPNC